MNGIWAGGLAVLLAAGTAVGGGIDLRQVPASAQWVLHVDLQRLRDGTIGQRMLADVNDESAQRRFAALTAVLELDVRTDLNSITVHGGDGKREDSVTLVKGRYNAQRLLTLLAANESYACEWVGNVELHRWVDGKGAESFGAFLADGTVMIAGSRDAAMRALDLAEGRIPAMSPEAMPVGDHMVTVYGSARLSGMNEANPHAALLKQSEHMTLTMDERNGEFVGAVTLKARTDEASAQMESIARGLQALMSLSEQERPELARVSKSVAVQRDGLAVTMSLNVPASDIVRLMDEEKARKPRNIQSVQ